MVVGEATSMRLVVASVRIGCSGLSASMAGVFSEDAGVCLLATRLGVACGKEGVLLAAAGGGNDSDGGARCCCTEGFRG